LVTFPPRCPALPRSALPRPAPLCPALPGWFAGRSGASEECWCGEAGRGNRLLLLLLLNLLILLLLLLLWD